MQKMIFIGAAASLLAAMPAHAADVAGTTSGVFINPLPGTASVSGVGTNDFLYGDDATGGGRNELKFTGTPFSANFESQFKIGTLFYYNGATFNPATSVDLKVTMDFSLPGALPDSISTFTFNLMSTDNVGTPEQQADFVYFPGVYGGNSFMIGGTTYFVELTGFQNVVGDGFLASDASALHVLENHSATADLYAKVTATAPRGVPEPASWAMMVIGLGVVGTALRRRAVVRAVQFA